MSKEELMKQLIDLYEQRKFVYPKASQLVVDEHIKKLELQLKELL